MFLVFSIKVLPIFSYNSNYFCIKVYDFLQVLLVLQRIKNDFFIFIKNAFIFYFHLYFNFEKTRVC